MPRRLEPKLLTVLREGYTRQKFSADLVAGLTVGIVALPLSIALAIASGVKPEQGLYTAIVAGFVSAALGGTRLLLSGVGAQPLAAMRQSGLLEKIGEENVAANIYEALEKAKHPKLPTGALTPP